LKIKVLKIFLYPFLEGKGLLYSVVVANEIKDERKIKKKRCMSTYSITSRSVLIRLDFDLPNTDRIGLTRNMKKAEMHNPSRGSLPVFHFFPLC